MHIKRISIFLIVIFLLIGCSANTANTPDATPVPVETESGTRSVREPWWRDAVFYEIFVRSFYDSNGDGIGDFNGITEKLDYIESLGVNAIWLMPIHPSPSYHGYDVTNYYSVNHEYGSLEDFKRLIDEAHKRDIRIIIDLVLNHTSSQHPFFADANSGQNSTYRDWYVWSETAAGGQWHKGNEGYYFGLFWGGMPDLNYRNPDVTRQMENVTRYWLEDMGLDGFRIDAAKHLIEDGAIVENTPATHEWFKNYFSYYKSVNENAYTVGEVYGAGAFIATTYDQQFDHIFNFEVASGIVNSVKGGSNTGINSAWKFTLKDIQDGNYATFLTNHDQNRVMSELNGDMDKAKLAAFMLLTAPGTPFIYYGEEIGMAGKKPDEDIRLPMQWDNSANSGFSVATPWRTVNPDFKNVNVISQENNTNSLLNHYKALINIRKQYSTLRTGSTYLLETGNTGVYAIIRSDDAGLFLVLANLKNETILDYQLSLKENILPEKSFMLINVYGSEDGAQLNILNGKFDEYKPLTQLPPYSINLFRLE